MFEIKPVEDQPDLVIAELLGVINDMANSVKRHEDACKGLEAIIKEYQARFDPCLRLQSRWLMPAPSMLGSRSPVMAKGGSWSALAPHFEFLGRFMSTGMWHLMHTGSHVAMTWATHWR